MRVGREEEGKQGRVTYWFEGKLGTRREGKVYGGDGGGNTGSRRWEVEV